MNKKTALLLFFVFLKFVLQYVAIDPVYELHRDEYLHLDIGKHFAWGYQSVPPVTAWISALIALLGNSVFWVKFFPALFGALTLVVVWQIVKTLNGSYFAFILTAVGVIFSALWRINTLYQPNSLEFLLWTLLFYTVIQYISSKEPKWLYAAALTFAIGFLNKYNIAFLLVGLVPGILLTEHRTILTNKHFYIALAVALVVIAPNLYWQYSNDFPVIRHLETLATNQLVNVNRLDFLIDQLLFFTGSLVAIVAGLIGFFRYKPFRKFRLFFWAVVCILGLYIYLRAKSYYAMGLYPMLIAFGAVYLEYLLQKGAWRYVRIVLVAIPMVFISGIYDIILPVLTPEKIEEKKEDFQKLGLLRWEDGQDHAIPQDFADMLGWKELAGLVDQAFDSIAEKDKVIIHCDNYGQAGAINFYTQQNYTEALSMNADYINWYELNDIEYKHVILVKTAFDDDPNRTEEKPYFENISVIGKIENPYAREIGSKVFLLKNATVSINGFFKEEIKSRIEQQSTY